MNIMRENIKLIQEISFLRKDVKGLESKLKSHTSKNGSGESKLEGAEGIQQEQELNNFNQSRESFDDNALQAKE
jgi:hypothetical protein